MHLTVRPSYFQNYTKHGLTISRKLCTAVGVRLHGPNGRVRIYAGQSYVGTGALNAKNKRLTTVAELFAKLGISENDVGDTIVEVGVMRDDEGPKLVFTVVT